MESDSKKYIIAAFDFDNTLISKDSLFHFISYSFGLRKLMMGALILSPILLLNKLRLVSSDVAKGKFLSFYLKGMKTIEFQKKCEAYSTEIDRYIKAEALEKLNWHKQEGHTMVIVSASIENWIKPWAFQNGFDHVISTKIDTSVELLTGKLSSPNCNGIEKVNRFLEQFPSREEYQLYAYGDSEGDKELLEIADFPFYRKFK